MGETGAEMSSQVGRGSLIMQPGSLPTQSVDLRWRWARVELPGLWRALGVGVGQCHGQAFWPARGGLVQLPMAREVHMFGCLRE